MLQLTSLRFLAAIYVVLFHTADQIFISARTLSTMHCRFMDMGFTAVSFFFVLSGYVLTLAYLDRGTPKGTFYLARFTRIYPLFFFTLLLDTPDYFTTLTAHVAPISALKTTAITIAANMFLIQSWIPHLRGMNGPNWSLSVEAFLYLLFPFLFFHLGRVTLRGLTIVGAATYLFGLLSILVLLRIHLSVSVIRFCPVLHVPSFIIGMVTALLFRGTINPSRYRAVLLMSTTAAFLAVIKFYIYIPMPLLNDGLLAPVYAALIFALSSDSRIIRATLGKPWTVLCGHASYGMYLLHIPLWHLVVRAGLNHSLAFYPVYLLLVVVLGIFSLNYIETPARTSLRRFLDYLLSLLRRHVALPTPAAPGLQATTKCSK